MRWVVQNKARGLRVERELLISIISMAISCGALGYAVASLRGAKRFQERTRSSIEEAKRVLELNKETDKERTDILKLSKDTYGYD